MMLANGLVQTVEQCIGRAVYLLHSGPAAAPSGAVYFGEQMKEGNLISVDMGGTSFDVCLIRDGAMPRTTESWEGDQRIAIKMVDIHTVGAGGGSLAQIDSLGLLKVGPESAGADPGPACYGRGDQPTVTDADVLLGYVPHDYFLGGEIKLGAAAAKKSMQNVGKPLGMDETTTAEAIFRSINSTMADKITEVMKRNGHDVRDSILIAGGGGGPTHGAFIARQLGIPTVLIPSVAALYSAFGMFAMDPGEMYLALQSRTIDCALGNNMLTLGFKLHEVAPKITVLRAPVNLSAYIVNAGAFAKLSPPDREAMKRVGVEAERRSADYLVKAANDAADQMRQQRADIYTLNDAEFAAFRASIRAAFGKMDAESGPAGKQIADILRGYW
jgi:N-methylhydantoinase A/oxoprolinase/acetone carboxylase beta subunit